MYNLIIRPLLFCIDPEKVHRMLLSWLKFYRYLFPVRACVRGYSRVSDPFSYGHLQFKNRIGLSAGFDKNAEAFDELADFGFGFLEVGTVTPDSQSGNPSPRIFRLVDDESLISRTGFNNCGVDAVRQHIRKYRKHSYVLGVNINKNPLSTGDQIVKDFESTFIHLYDCVDYFTLNWGSIDNDLFAMVLEKLTIFRQAANKRCNIFIKLPADIDEKALDTVISLAYKYSIEGFIATGPTRDRSIVKAVLTMFLQGATEIYKMQNNLYLSSQSRKYEIYQEFLQLVMKYYTIHHGTSFYAEHLGLSLPHFCSTIKKVAGNTPLEVIASIILMDAKSRLKSTNEPVKNIALSLGFNNISFFNKFFKQHTGVTPQEYRGH